MKTASCLFVTLLIVLFAGTPPVLAQIDFVKHVVDGSCGGAQDVCSAYINDDDVRDFVVCSYDDYTIVWYEEISPNTWIPHFVDAWCVGGWSLDTGDLDGDGDTDVAAAAFLGDEITWYENDGQGGFTEHFLFSTIGPECVRIADLDRDGLLDILAASFFSDNVLWLENNGDGTFTTHLLMSAIDTACYLDVVDIDNDMDNDVLVASVTPNTILLLENDGMGSFTRYTISDSYEWARCACGVDMDQDGNLDVLAVAQAAGTVDWFERVGPTDWTQHSIATGLEGAWYAVATDLDNDGDLDVVGGGLQSNTVAWWENTDGAAMSWTEHIVSNTFSGTQTVKACDYDDDGDDDILAVGFLADEVAVWEQLPTGNNVILDITPATVPVIVNPGGEFIYDLHVECYIGSLVMGYLWTSATLPSGNTTPPLFSVRIPYAPGMVINVTEIHQIVPGFAPAGDYTWMVNAGLDPYNVPFASDSFLFEVNPASAADGSTEWSTNAAERILAGMDSPQPAATRTLPTEFALNPTPNPFNPATTLNVTLPETAELSVTVYNIAGQQVATLGDGTYSAGSHALTFDGSSLSSGVYFIIANANSQLATQKVVLMK